MSLSIKFKNAERSLLSLLNKYLGFIFRAIGRFIGAIRLGIKTRFTVMLIPHSEKKVISFKISALRLTFLGILFFSILSGSIASVVLLRIKSLDDRENREQLAMVSQHKRNYHQAVENLNRNYLPFKNTLNKFLKGHLPPEMLEDSLRSGDYQDITVIEETRSGQTPLVPFLEKVDRDIEIFTRALVERAEQESRINELLKIIPAKWPVGHNQGYITAHFGPAPHPIKRMWYLHKGIDIAYKRGTPVVAAADGKVIEQQYNRDYGYYVVIRHEYGFYTKYAHLDSAYVKEGDDVTQGQPVGPLGNTGLSTGPHLHYEIRINSQVIDPYRYIQLLRMN